MSPLIGKSRWVLEIGLLALVLAVPLLGSGRCFAPQAAQPLPAGLAIGFDPDQVRGRLGPPSRIARQAFAFRCLEQWTYTQPPLRLVFECPRGRKPWLRQV